MIKLKYCRCCENDAAWIGQLDDLSMLTPSDIEMVILSKWVKVQTASKTGLL